VALATVVRGEQNEDTAPPVREQAQSAAEAAREAASRWSWVFESDAEEAGPKPFFGVVAEPVPRVLRDYIELPKGVGLLLTKISKDSPAEKAGLKDNDVLIEFDGQMIVNFSQFSTLISLKKPGDVVKVKVLRKGGSVETEVILEERVRKGGRWREAPAAPDAPAVPDDELGSNWQEWIPGHIRVYVDENEKVSVDLSQLKEDIGELGARLKTMDLTDPASWEDIVRDYGDLGNRSTIVMIKDQRVSFESADGSVTLWNEAGEEFVEVRDADGALLYAGARAGIADAPEAERVEALLERFDASAARIETDLGDQDAIEVEVEKDAGAPMQ